MSSRRDRGTRKSVSYRSSLLSTGRRRRSGRGGDEEEEDEDDDYDDDEDDEERFYRKRDRHQRCGQGEGDEEKGEEDLRAGDERRTMKEGGRSASGTAPPLAEQAAGDRLNFLSRLPFTVGIQKDTQGAKALIKQRVVQVANYETATLGFAVLTYFLDSNVAPGTADTTMSLL
ncbi:amine-terminal region of a tm vesicle-mediated sorter [Cystoisospora suis]|uniref:Amine-terminal region of a tm vesicle-mediated sorter n=1 Tax=Cystoisospora suis TaxID=483139 RepID=A0A2C6KH32_9APIC|nr:amine-terminal region of a tm vesicle-mediated sorter [Cystoisospora suis]